MEGVLKSSRFLQMLMHERLIVLNPAIPPVLLRFFRARIQVCAQLVDHARVVNRARVAAHIAPAVMYSWFVNRFGS